MKILETGCQVENGKQKIEAEWQDKPVKICEDLWRSVKILWVKIVRRN